MTPFPPSLVRIPWCQTHARVAQGTTRQGLLPAGGPGLMHVQPPMGLSTMKISYKSRTSYYVCVLKTTNSRWSPNQQSGPKRPSARNKKRQAQSLDNLIFTEILPKAGLCQSLNVNKWATSLGPFLLPLWTILAEQDARTEATCRVVIGRYRRVPRVFLHGLKCSAC